MKRSKFTDSQVMEALKRAEAGVAVPEICRELGISSATFYKWRAKPWTSQELRTTISHALNYCDLLSLASSRQAG